MPLPLIPAIVAGAAAVSTAVGAKKGVDATKNMKETKSILEDLERRYKRAFDTFELQKESSNATFEEVGKTKLYILTDTFPTFTREFGKLKNVNFSDKTKFDSLNSIPDSHQLLRDVEKQSVKAAEVLSAGLSSLAGGAVAAFGAVGATTAFASASTGTAIATLSGVAAKNATLAFLGGGALKAGGLGVAGGMTVLGGIALAPAIAIGGMLFESNTRKKLEEAKSERAKINTEIEKLNKGADLMSTLQSKANQVNVLLGEVQMLFSTSIQRLQEIVSVEGTDYENFRKESQDAVFQTYQIAAIMKKLLDQSLINEQGKLNTAVNSTLIDTKRFVDELNRK